MNGNNSTFSLLLSVISESLVLQASVLKFVCDESLEDKARNEESQLQSSFSTLTQKLQACQTQHQARVVQSTQSPASECINILQPVHSILALSYPADSC